jgi:hypothetical protein
MFKVVFGFFRRLCIRYDGHGLVQSIAFTLLRRRTCRFAGFDQMVSVDMSGLIPVVTMLVW